MASSSFGECLGPDQKDTGEVLEATKRMLSGDSRFGGVGTNSCGKKSERYVNKSNSYLRKSPGRELLHQTLASGEVTKRMLSDIKNLICLHT